MHACVKCQKTEQQIGAVTTLGLGFAGVVNLLGPVETYPIKGGMAAFSREWGVTAAGNSREEALLHLSELIRLFRELHQSVRVPQKENPA